MPNAKDKPFWESPVAAMPLQVPVVMSEADSIKDCIKAMQDHHTGCVLIADENKVMTGIFSERDVMVKYIGTDLSGETPISQVMTSNVLTIDPDATVSQAVDFFGKHHIRHLPVCKETNKLVGLLSIRALTDFIAEHLPEDILNLPPKHDIVSTEADGA
ncbi:MAG: CBS domain-containing protein [Planctomycetes bacterium]|nr:CBS domain-containing protein [Planctomycetota bacterium]